MLLQTLLVTALTVLVGGFLLNYVIDGIYNDSFANIFVDVMMLCMWMSRLPLTGTGD